MYNIGKSIISILIGSLIIMGCNSTPDEVLSKEDMAQLLADMHIGESVVDVERSKFYNDSLKKVVKQSILIKHNVSQAQLDTSFAWYGHNIEEYIAVYDRVIEILDNKVNNLGTNVVEKTNITFDGDSIDVWQNVRHYAINHKSPSQYITFTLSKDQHWENGDNYIWRLKLLNNMSQLKWGIAVDYSDGSSEFVNTTISNEGWNEIKISPESTKTLNRVYGYIYVLPKESEVIYLDSISLVRTRANERTYRQRIGQREFEYGKNNNKENSTENKTKAEESKSEEKSESNTTNQPLNELVKSPKNYESTKKELKDSKSTTAQPTNKKLKLHGN